MILTQIFYQDETWANENQSLSMGWHMPEKEVLGNNTASNRFDVMVRGVGRRFSDGMLGGISSVPSGAGKRVIIVDIGSKNGFLGCGMAFVGKKNTQDYHNEMCATHFEEWMVEVLKKIPDHSVIVLDQASYHRRVTEETRNPTTSWRKSEVIQFLRSKNIAVPEPYTCFEDAKLPCLRQLAKENRVVQRFVVQDMIDNCGKDVKLLWLPVAHCELNPIELVWSSVKTEIAKSNKTFKIIDVLPLCKEKLSNVKSDLWAKCVQHVIELEDKIMEKERIAEKYLDEVRHQIIIRVSDSDSEEDTDTDSLEEA